MKEENALAIIFVVLILTVGGCVYGMHHDTALTQQEQEKTKQMEIQVRMDSIQIITNFKNKNNEHEN